MSALIKILLVSLIAVLLTTKVYSYPGVTSTQTAADGEDFYSERDEKVFAHIHYAVHFESRKPDSFYGHISTPNNHKLSNLKVYLHSLSHPQVNVQSRLLEFVPADGETDYKNPKLFYVSKAWFNLLGHWLIIMEFNFEGQHHKIEIPVHIVK